MEREQAQIKTEYSFLEWVSRASASILGNSLGNYGDIECHRKEWAWLFCLWSGHPTPRPHLPPRGIAWSLWLCLVPWFSCLLALGFCRLSATVTVTSFLSSCTTMGLGRCLHLCTWPGLGTWRARESCNVPAPSSGEEFRTGRNLESCCSNSTGSLGWSSVWGLWLWNRMFAERTLSVIVSLWKMWVMQSDMERSCPEMLLLTFWCISCQYLFSSASVCLCVLTVNHTVRLPVYTELYTAFKKLGTFISS